MRGGWKILIFLCTAMVCVTAIAVALIARSDRSPYRFERVEGGKTVYVYRIHAETGTVERVFPGGLSKANGPEN